MKNNDKLLNILHHQKILFSFVCIYKMCYISKEAYKKCEIEIIDYDKPFRTNRRNLEIQSDYKNWAVVFYKCHPKKENNSTDKN